MTRSRPGDAPRIMLAGPDPYLAFLIQLDLPDAVVVEVGHRQGEESPRPDLAIVDLTHPGATELLARREQAAMIGIVDGARASGTVIPVGLDGLLVRPFAPAELYRAVRGALGIAEQGPSGAPVRRLWSWLGPARFAAVAVAAALELAVGVSTPRTALLAAAFVYGGFRLIPREVDRRLAWLDAAVASLLIALTGGLRSNYMVFGLAASLGAGLTARLPGAALAGALVSAGAFLSVVDSLALGVARPREIVAWTLLFPLTALTGSLAARIWGQEGRDRARRLTEANQVLSTLYQLARAMPGDLDLAGVATAALKEAGEVLKAPAGALLVAEAGVLSVAGSFGLPQAPEIRLHREAPSLAGLLEGGIQVVTERDIPPPLAPVLQEHPYWLSAPLRHGGSTLGLLLVASSGSSQLPANRIYLQHLANETAVAVENARIFARVRELSADEERARLARELHDGVAQALTHVRIELDFLARDAGPGPEGVQKEAARLARVVDRALADVRSTILAFRATLSGEGLTGSLRSYLRDLRALGGPDIGFSAHGTVQLPRDVQAGVFRIAQEAVSDALRHAQASRVEVVLEADGRGLRLQVDDDGMGMNQAGQGRGVGLADLQARAAGIDGRLEVCERPGGGTRVQLVVGGSASDSRPVETARPT